MMGSNKLDPTSTNPFKKYPFTFSHKSAARGMAEYIEVCTALRMALRHPNAVPEGRHTILKLLQSPDFKPERSPFTCYLTQDQWTWVSKALRGWQRNDGYSPRPYELMIRAKNRPTTKRRKK